MIWMRMTLIAAVRCSDGAVICADSQETTEDHRKFCQKLRVFQGEEFDVAICGCGDEGDLIDGFTEHLDQELKGCTSKNLTELRDFIQGRLQSYLTKNAALFQGVPDIRFLIAATCKSDTSFELWESKLSTLTRIQEFDLMGWDESLYHDVANNFFHHKQVRINQAIPLLLHVFEMAKRTCRNVNSPFSVAIVSPYLIGMLSERSVEEYTAIGLTYSKLLESLLLSCIDTAIPKADFEKRLEWFNREIKRLREDYWKVAGARIGESFGRDDMFTNLMYKTIPQGT